MSGDMAAVLAIVLGVASIALSAANWWRERKRRSSQ